MAFRYWISGPRILNGLVRPGVSFYARDLKRHPPGRQRASGTILEGRRLSDQSRKYHLG
jgi:hypothetical protein